jgi:hypothetical protein
LPPGAGATADGSLPKGGAPTAGAATAATDEGAAGTGVAGTGNASGQGSGVNVNGGSVEGGTIPPENIVTGSGIPKTLTHEDLGEIVGAGSFKDVYAVNGRQDIVVAIERNPTPDTLKYISEEVDALNELDAMGVPTVKNYGIVDVDGNPGIVMERIDGAVSSKTLLENGDLSKSGQLNAQSIDDLTAIRDGLVKNNIDPSDFQVLIGKDGRVFVNDPMGVMKGINADTLDQIDALINLARKNVEQH